MFESILQNVSPLWTLPNSSQRISGWRIQRHSSIVGDSQIRIHMPLDVPFKQGDARVP